MISFPSEHPVASRVIPTYRFDPKSLVQHERYDVIFHADKHILRLRLNIASSPSTTNHWMRQLHRYFNLLDRDGDGYLNAYEIGFALPVSSVREAMQTGFAYSIVDEPERILQDFDRDADGRVSFDEFAAYYLPAIKSSIMLHSIPAPGDSVNRSNDSLFKRFDTDRDGRLSRTELGSLEKFLDTLDRDEDECLSLSEINPKPNNTDAPDAKQQPAAAVPEMIEVYRAGEIPDASINALLKRYDANKDGKVQLGESPFPPEVFAKLDEDGNGVLTRSELLAWKLAPADAELELLPDQRSVRLRSGSEQLTALGVRIDTLPDGRLIIRMNGRMLDVGCSADEPLFPSMPGSRRFPSPQPMGVGENTILDLFDRAIVPKSAT